MNNYFSHQHIIIIPIHSECTDCNMYYFSFIFQRFQLSWVNTNVVCYIHYIICNFRLFLVVATFHVLVHIEHSFDGHTQHIEL